MAVKETRTTAKFSTLYRSYTHTQNQNNSLMPSYGQFGSLQKEVICYHGVRTEEYVTSIATTMRISWVSDSGKYAFTCGDKPIKAQLVTTAMMLIVSNANWKNKKTKCQICVCVCVCVSMCMWFMRTQICIMTWVWHRYYKEKVIYEDIFSVPII